MAETSVIFPDGTQIFVRSIVSVQILAGTPTVISLGLGVSLVDYSYTAPDAASAAGLRAQINDAIDGKRSGTITMPIVAAIPVITQITPTTFDLFADTIYIQGQNFEAATVGKIQCEDAAGGKNSSGYWMNCTFINSTLLSAAPGASGDTILGPGPVLIYYEDTGAVQSNAINGTNTVGTIITIP